MTVHSCTLSLECQLLPLSGVRNGLSIKNISDFFWSIKKIMYIMKIFF